MQLWPLLRLSSTAVTTGTTPHQFVVNPEKSDLVGGAGMRFHIEVMARLADATLANTLERPSS